VTSVHRQLNEHIFHFYKKYRQRLSPDNEPRANVVRWGLIFLRAKTYIRVSLNSLAPPLAEPGFRDENVITRARSHGFGLLLFCETRHFEG
jgi:hypothetical protein